MPWDRALDPITHDRIDDGKGSFATTETAEPSVQHAILDHRNEWIGDPAQGSDLNRIPRKGNRRTAQRRLDAARDALQPLIKAGVISKLKLDLDTDAETGEYVVVGSAFDAQNVETPITQLLGYGP